MDNPHLFLASSAAAPPGHSAPGAFAGAGVGSSSLAVHRQTPSVSQPTVGTDLNEAANVLVDLPAQVALGNVLPVNDFSDAVYLGLIQLIHPRGGHWVKVGFGQYFGSHDWPDAVDTAQGHMRPLPVGHVNASDSNHYMPPAS